MIFLPAIIGTTTGLRECVLDAADQLASESRKDEAVKCRFYALTCRSRSGAALLLSFDLLFGYQHITLGVSQHV